MGISPGLFQFGEFKPDLSDLDTGVSRNITNVVPRGDGYGPFPDFTAFSKPLPDVCRGFFYARNADGSVTIFAGTATNLYKLSSTDLSWTNVSNAGGPYAAVPSGYHWQFVQFNTKVIAVQVNVVPQVFDLSSPATFSNLGGSPPQAALIAIINRFVVLAGILGFPYRVQWSGLNAITTWDNLTSQSNFQDLASGGRVTGIAGGDQFGVVFQDSAIRSMIFAPGSSVIFDILLIASNDGLLSPFAAVNAADKIYFCSPQGFKVVVPGGYPEPIGKEKIDRTFFADLDSAGLQMLIAATDPTTTRVFWAYKSMGGEFGLFDKIILYDRVLDRFSIVNMSGEYLAALSTPGLSLEQLDHVAPGIITISGAANNGTGAIRLTLSGLTAGSPPSNTDLTIADTVEVYGVTGTTEANGNWRFTIISPTQIDLIGSTFANTYTGGGAIGGAMDQLGFSLDTISVASLATLGMVGPSHSLGTFKGPNLEAQLETPEADGNGRRFFVSAVRPITDCPITLASVAARDNAQVPSSTYTSEVAVNDIGLCPVDGGGIDTRYARVKVRMPYGASWTNAMGIEPEFRMTGWR